MYCYVIFGESEDKHTRLYLYECTKQLDPGEVVIVPTKNTSKAALVQSIFEVIPEEITFDSSKIKSIVSRADNAVSSDMVRSYLLALVDEYKDGIITKEELYAIIEHLISSTEIEADDDSELAEIINVRLPETCSYYIDEPGEAEIKELGFWKELKDIEYKLRYGYSFWNSPESRFHDIEEDPIEYTDEYLRIELELERLIRKEIGEGGYMGFCHKYWWTKKKLLKNRFGIEWKSPVDLNPMVNFD